MAYFDAIISFGVHTEVVEHSAGILSLHTHDLWDRTDPVRLMIRDENRFS